MKLGSQSGVTWTLDPTIRHLNHGSFGAVPRAVQNERDRLLAEVESNPVLWFDSLAERVALARRELAEIFHVHSQHLAFVPNASAGASVVYQSLRGAEPVNVMTTNHGYGAVTAGAARLARSTGGHHHSVSIPLNATAQQVRRLLADAMDAYRPTLLVVDQVTSGTARAFPTQEIALDARSRGVLTLVDGANAPGVIADPVCREADYWVGNLHKFACAPRGTALLYVRDSAQHLYPVIDSWGTDLAFPERFDHTGTLDLTAWLSAAFAWNYLDERVGWDRIRSECAELAEAGQRVVAEALSEIVHEPVPDVGQPVGPLKLLRLPRGLGSTRQAGDALRKPLIQEVGVAAAFPSFDGEGYLRLSTHLYNDISDYHHLAKVGIPLLREWARASSSRSVAS